MSWNQKEKEEIEYRIDLIKQFLEHWSQYDKLFDDAFHKKNVKSEQEEKFLKLKSQLARRHQYIMDYLGKEYHRPEPITPYLSDTVTLYNMVGIHHDFYKKLKLQWHTTTLHLNQALGVLLTHLEIELPLEA